MKFYQVEIQDNDRSYATLYVFAPGLDSVEARVKRWLEEKAPHMCRPATKLELNEVDPRNVLKSTDKKPKKAKKRG